MKSKKTQAYKHPKAMVESRFVGKGTRIWPYAHIQKGARVGEGCNVCEHCYIENGAVVGNMVTIKNGVSIWEGVTISDKVFLGPNMVFTNDLNPRSRVKRKIVKTLVNKGATIGANATILAGVTIGEYAMVGAGAVITNDVPSYALVYGNPARLKGHVCECGLKLNPLKGNSMCGCGRRYNMNKGSLKQLY